MNICDITVILNMNFVYLLCCKIVFDDDEESGVEDLNPVPEKCQYISIVL